MAKGTAEGQSPGKGKAESSGPEPSPEEPSSGPETSGRISRNGLLCKVAESSGSAETSAALVGPPGLAEGRPGASTGSERTFGETRLAAGNVCYKCKKSGHYRANYPVRTKEGTKRKRSGVTG